MKEGRKGKSMKWRSTTVQRKRENTKSDPQNVI